MKYRSVFKVQTRSDADVQTEDLQISWDFDHEILFMKNSCDGVLSGVDLYVDVLPLSASAQTIA